jgi:ribosomal protein L24
MTCLVTGQASRRLGNGGRGGHVLGRHVGYTKGEEGVVLCDLNYYDTVTIDRVLDYKAHLRGAAASWYNLIDVSNVMYITFTDVLSTIVALTT